MHSKMEDMPVVFQVGSSCSRDVEWGEMNVAFESFAAGTDTRPMFKGLPNDSCQCPHWGYLLKGKMRIISLDHEEVISAGEAYYLSPGHNVLAEEDCELLEFSPRGEYQKTMEAASHNMENM